MSTTNNTEPEIPAARYLSAEFVSKELGREGARRPAGDRRHRRRTDPGTRRSGRGRYGHPDRQARALDRVRWYPPEHQPSSVPRRRDQQPGAARRPHVPGLAASTDRPTELRLFRRRIRRRRRSALPPGTSAMGGLRSAQRDATSRAPPRTDLFLRRRHPGHGCGCARDRPRWHAGNRNPPRRTASRDRRGGLGREWDR